MVSLPLHTERFSDPKAVEEYAYNSGVEISGSAIVDASSGEVFDAWIRRIWLSDWAELAPGVGRGLVGHAKLMPLSVKERIVSVGLPTAADDRVASVCYKVYDVGPFPVVHGSHIDLVSFVPVRDGDSGDGDYDLVQRSRKTLVVWRIKTTATTMGDVLCGGALFRLMLRCVV
ncbi:hypothetical protein PybrP1_009573 [[Pythium] brassicae (nom. inval.)]|nr:hypothetical protein PybrP1_009573 [[Pythium] brassicae (nom. inval.)]